MKAFGRLSLPALLLLTLSATFPASAAQRGFEIEDLYRLKGLATPALSKDGKTVVYALTTSDIRASKRRTNLWRASATGGDATQLTFGESADTDPQFTPDGRAIAFLSTRVENEAQLFLLPLGGGEAEKKTSFPGGVSGVLFSEDGKKIVFAATVYPECGADVACNKKAADAREKNKLKAHIADRLLFRHWTAWQDGQRTHLLMQDLESGKLTDLTPGDFDSPVFSLGGRDYDLSKDGRLVVFASNRDANEAATTNADLYLVETSASAEALKAPRRLTKQNPSWDGGPRFSPDGTTIWYRTQTIATYESDRFRLAKLDVASGTSTVLTEKSFDNQINDLEPSDDGKTVYFTADVAGRVPLCSFDVATGRIDTLSSTGVVDGFAMGPGDAFAVILRRQIGLPGTLFNVPLRVRRAELKISSHNDELLKEVDVRPGEEITVTGANGKKIQVWIVKPHGFDPAKKYPLILNVHGGPQQQWADAFRGDWQVYPGSGYVVAFPNPHGSTGFGQDFTAAISGDWDGKVMTDIDRVREHLAALPYVDAGRMGFMGWSWGGYAAMWQAGNRPDAWKAIASMMGVYDLRSMYSSTEEVWFPHWDLGGAPWDKAAAYTKQSPSSYVKSYKTPTLVVTGQRDYRVPYAQSIMFFTDLQLRNVPSRLLVFEKAGHWPSWAEMATYYAAHLDWFHKYLGGAPSPWDPVKLVSGTQWDEAKPAAK